MLNMQRIETQKVNLPGVEKILAVGSGKGGVGKSTVALNLAYALKEQGKKVAIVDADVYGPSIPRMLGVKEKPEIDEHNKMIPHITDGIKSISMGYLLPDETATVWRGPMVIKALHQLLAGTNWQYDSEPVEILIIDLPPGTGDIQLTLSKNYPISGAIMVSTPQDLAILDVKKAVDMFQKVGVPILGIIENMSYLEKENGEKSRIFGPSHVKPYAETQNIPLLAEIPIKESLMKPGKKENISFFSEIAELVG